MIICTRYGQMLEKGKVSMLVNANGLTKPHGKTK